MKKSDYDPTDILHVKSGETLLSKMQSQGLNSLIQDEAELTAFLETHGLSLLDLKRPLTADRFFYVKHPKAYSDKQHRLSRPYNTRSLNLMLYKTRSFSPNLDMILKQGPQHILELGMGQGRMLLELAALCKTSKLMGVHKGEEEVDLEATAQFFNLDYSDRCEAVIFDLESGNLPSGQVRSFDLILSQATTRYLRDKIFFLENIYKALAPDGWAFIDIHMLHILDAQGNEIALKEYFSRSPWVEVMTFDPSASILRLHKRPSVDLQFGLTWLPSQSYERTWSQELQNNDTVGWKSTYQL